MSRVLLVNTSYDAKGKAFETFFAPLGLLSIAEPLRENGYDVVLVDPQIDAHPREKIRKALETPTLFVGMTTFMGPNITNVRNLSGYIKSLSPRTPIIWGGPLATSVPDICFNEAPVDFIMMGMGDNSVVDIADALMRKAHPSTIAHLSYRDGKNTQIKGIYRYTESLDNLPFPALDIWEKGIRRSGFIPIMSSRGCPRNCFFCYNNTFTGRKMWFPRSAENVIREMDHWASRFDMMTFEFMDDNFLVNTKRACSILNTLKQRDYRIDRLVGHVDDFKPDIVERISGYITKICFSIETASPRMQKLMNKPIDLDKAVQLAERLMAKGVKRITSIFMFGMPTETDEDIRESIEMACRLRRVSEKIAMPAFIYNPQPGDDIIPRFDFFNRMPFSLDTLSNIDMEPNRSQRIAPEIRPWMTNEDIRFYLRFILVWFHHFHYEVRATQDIDVEAIYRENRRVAELFKNVPLTQT